MGFLCFWLIEMVELSTHKLLVASSKSKVDAKNRKLLCQPAENPKYQKSIVSLGHE